MILHGFEACRHSEGTRGGGLNIVADGLGLKCKYSTGDFQNSTIFFFFFITN